MAQTFAFFRDTVYSDGRYESGSKDIKQQVSQVIKKRAIPG